MPFVSPLGLKPFERNAPLLPTYAALKSQSRPTWRSSVRFQVYKVELWKSGGKYQRMEVGRVNVASGAGIVGPNCAGNGLGMPILPQGSSKFTSLKLNVAPFAPTFNFSDVNFDDPWGSIGIPSPFPAQFGPTIPAPDATFTLPTSIRWYFPPDFHSSTLYTWNLTLERQVGRDWLLRAAYVGNKGAFLSNGFKPSGETNGILIWRSGFPFSILSGRDNSFSAVGHDRADFIGTDLNAAQLSSDRPHNQLIAQWFDTSLFAANAVGTFGNTGKNILLGPRSFNTDLGFLKATQVTERTSIQFRAEFFNIFNNVNFRNPGNTLGGGDFGRLTSAFDPRILQFGLKVLF